jgi:hypothetical protein
LVNPGLKAFIPGNITKVSHEDISDLLLARGFAVLILNGTDKEIRLPNGEPTIDLFEYLTIKDAAKAPPEFASTLVDLYAKYRLDRFPLAITGYMCVERGITVQSSEFLFDYAIVAPIRDKAEAYQAMARVFGNVGGFAGYKSATIYSDSKTFMRVRDQEESAVHVARIVHEEGLELVDASVLERVVKKAEAADLDHRIFDTQEEAIAYAKTMGVHLQKRISNIAAKEIQINGKNPDIDYILKRHQGLDQAHRARMVPTDKDQWCVYWHPSWFPKPAPKRMILVRKKTA